MRETRTKPVILLLAAMAVGLWTATVAAAPSEKLVAIDAGDFIGPRMAFATDAGVYPHGDNARQCQSVAMAIAASRFISFIACLPP